MFCRVTKSEPGKLAMYCDNRATLLKMCSDFDRAARHPPPGHARRNPLIERKAGLSLQGISCGETTAGLPHVFWPQIGRTYAFNYTCSAPMANGKTGCGNQHGKEPNLELLICGQLVFFIPAPTIVCHKTKKAMSNLRAGIFLDYYVSPTGEFTGQYICVCLEDFVGESLHRDVGKQHFNLKLHRVEVVKLPPQATRPIFPLKDKYYESNYTMPGLGRQETMAARPLQDYDQMKPKIDIADYNGTEEDEALQVRLNNNLYAYEDCHKVLTDGPRRPNRPCHSKVGQMSGRHVQRSMVKTTLYA